MKRVIVHFDGLVLKGFCHVDQQPIDAGVQHELGLVFADQETVSLVTSMRNLSRPQVSGMQIEQDLKLQFVGENVAQSIGKEIKK